MLLKGEKSLLRHNSRTSCYQHIQYLRSGKISKSKFSNGGGYSYTIV